MTASEIDLLLAEIELIHKPYRFKIAFEQRTFHKEFSISFIVKKTEWRTTFRLDDGQESRLHGIINRTIATKLIEEVAGTL